MEEVKLMDVLNILLPILGGVSVIVYSLIKLHVDVGHIKKQITALFELHNKGKD